jgi:hypothetical protein
MKLWMPCVGDEVVILAPFSLNTQVCLLLCDALQGPFRWDYPSMEFLNESGQPRVYEDIVFPEGTILALKSVMHERSGTAGLKLQVVSSLNPRLTSRKNISFWITALQFNTMEGRAHKIRKSL